MEIVYLFIKDHSKFKNQSLNFGSEYIFNYSEEFKNLNIIENGLYINNHYQLNTNIQLLNITSIIGQNGTGKTSILNFIRENFAQGLPLESPCIFITKINKKFVVYHTEDLPIENEISYPDFFVNKIKQKKEQIRGQGVRNPFEITLGYDFRGFDFTDLIYFSNVYDTSGGSFDLKGISDISTNNLVLLDYDRDIKNKIITVAANHNVLASFVNNEIHRQINFIHKFHKSNELPFEIPTELLFTAKNDYFKLTDNNFLNNSSLFGYISYFITRGHQTNLDLDKSEQKIKFRLMVNIYLSFVVDFFLSHQNIDEYIILDEIFYNENKNNIETSELLENISLLYDRFQSHLSNKYENDHFKNIHELILFIDSINEDENSSIGFSVEGIRVNIQKDDDSSFDKFMKLYTGSIFIRPFLNFRWRNISSGERALLNLYSRFNSLADSDILGGKLNRHLIILIDEGDLYLHPQWQKSFVKILLDFLPTIFTDKTIQLIFTTNSPIPASDLLSYNTIFLERYSDSSGNISTMVKDSLNEQKETFAANIHTLLSDSFFVDNGLIGDFASLKINIIIEQLSKRMELTFDERENMRKLIHQIGEPIIKNKLMQMYNDRFNLDIHERLEKIEKILKL
ncbi:AAA family ATPase [Chryseobacterium scophthalmum]|uniref:AAA family ATPase n=1 Tax=Chryseobacterium scophthalmum TaxID=59733 RepID=UPI000C9E75A3|nr:AAA family ATPase [Chryseobacterium scophthalmum]